MTTPFFFLDSKMFLDLLCTKLKHSILLDDLQALHTSEMEGEGAQRSDWPEEEI